MEFRFILSLGVFVFAVIVRIIVIRFACGLLWNEVYFGFHLKGKCGTE